MSGGRRTTTPPGAGEAITAEAREPDELSGLDALEEALQELEPGTILAVSRTEPRHARGFLEDMEISPQELAGIRGYLQRTWGGGKFKLQWKVRDATGAQKFARGCALFTIAGPPMFRGKRVLPDGTIEDPPPPPAANPAPPPVVYAHPPPQPGAARDYASELLGQLVPLVLNKADGSPLDVVQLVGALQNTLRTGSEPDPFGQVERTLGLLTKLRDTFGDGESERGEPEDSGGLLGGLTGNGGIEKLLLMKLLGEHQQPQQQQAPPGWQMGPQGWQPAPQAPQAPQFPPAPPGWRLTPQGWQRLHETPQAHGEELDTIEPAANPAPPTKPVVHEAQPELDDDDDDEPMTADEIAEEIANCTPAEQEAILAKMCERFGLPAEQVQEAFAAASQPQTFPKTPIVVGGEE